MSILHEIVDEGKTIRSSSVIEGREVILKAKYNSNEDLQENYQVAVETFEKHINSIKLTDLKNGKESKQFIKKLGRFSFSFFKNHPSDDIAVFLGKKIISIPVLNGRAQWKEAYVKGDVKRGHSVGFGGRQNAFFLSLRPAKAS